uniref:Uncharacterized protein n=1 Tax=Helianthus annuus TaxID=4232 RepID=A0A251UIX9_HELAN
MNHMSSNQLVAIRDQEIERERTMESSGDGDDDIRLKVVGSVYASHPEEHTEAAGSILCKVLDEMSV